MRKNNIIKVIIYKKKDKHFLYKKLYIKEAFNKKKLGIKKFVIYKKKPYIRQNSINKKVINKQKLYIGKLVCKKKLNIIFNKASI